MRRLRACGRLPAARPLDPCQPRGGAPPLPGSGLRAHLERVAPQLWARGGLGNLGTRAARLAFRDTPPPGRAGAIVARAQAPAKVMRPREPARCCCKETFVDRSTTFTGAAVVA